MFCRNCGEKIDDDSIFCSSCGEKLSAELKALYCKKCGTKINDDDVYCSGCGNPVNENNDEKEYLSEGDKIKAFIVFTIISVAIIVGILITE